MNKQDKIDSLNNGTSRDIFDFIKSRSSKNAKPKAKKKEGKKK